MDIGASIKNQYTVIEHIGRGGMADVWSARDQRLRRMVAIKTIAAGLSQDVDPVTLFEKEAQTIAQMEHPHILPIYDFGEYDNSLYIVMRYVTGGSLEAELQNGPMEMDEVLRLGDAVAKALDYAHSNNVIHLDLKPPNILLDSGGSPYLADFGLATVLDKQGRAQNPGSGTLLYMAPEQLTSDTIDHRADIYAFSIMLFHMLTGQLPFEGRVPLAMRQLQAGDKLPFIDEINEDVPHEFNAVLHKGTEQDPFNRYATHADMMAALREIVQPAGALSTATSPIPHMNIEPYQLETQQVETSDSGLLEAVDLYSRARYNWQGGQGRFLLGVTHFMLMSGYYQDAEHYGLDIDHEGYQMLLRGAIEYDYELAYWWEQVHDADRRWVCLHALRSGNAPARIRSFYHLETLPDDEANPVIPRLVAQALEIEVDNTAKLAALKVLGTRSKLIKRPTMSIMTEYRGRLLSSMTRMGIEIAADGQWQEAVYSPEVDLLVAEQAFDESPEVAEYAARTVGKMRSLAGVGYLANAQINDRPGSLDALAYVRDETPALPDIVSRQARFYAWITNTVRRLTAHPLEAILRFVLALLGGAIAMGEWVYINFRSQELFTAQRWGNTLAMGLVFGLFTGLTYIVTGETTRRLAGFWSWWMRLGIILIVGAVVGILPYAGFTWLYLQYVPVWDVVRFGSFGLIAAPILISLLHLRPWQAFLLTVGLIFLPIAYTYRAYYFQGETTVASVALIGVLLGVFIGWRAAVLSPVRPQLPISGNRLLESSLSAVLGIGWAAAIWMIFAAMRQSIIAGQPMTWDTVTWIIFGCMVAGTIISYWLQNSSRWIFSLVASVAFIAIFQVVAWHNFDYSYTVPLPANQPAVEVVYAEGVPLSPMSDSPLIYLAEHSQIFTLLIPMVAVIALGMNLMPMLEGWWLWIGSPQSPKMRGGWLAGALIYTLILTGLGSVLALFSMTHNVIWGLGWSAWGFITFVFALAAYRWTRWGMHGLLWSAMVFVLGGFLFDAVNMQYQASQGDTPQLLRSFPIDLPLISWTPILTALVFWALWSVVLGFFTWGAVRQRLWAGIGLVGMLIGWYIVAISSPIQGSMAVFAITNVAFLAFGLLPRSAHMEAGRFMLPQFFAPSPEPMKPKHEGHDMKTLRIPHPAANDLTERKPARIAKSVEVATTVDVGLDTELVNEAIEFNAQETAELNRLLAESDVKAAGFQLSHDDDSEEIDIGELNRLLAESDVKAAGFRTPEVDEPAAMEVDELNRLLAESDVKAAGFSNRDLTDSQYHTQLDISMSQQVSSDETEADNDADVVDINAPEVDEVPYIKDPTQLPTEPFPGGRSLADSNKVTTEDIPQFKESRRETDVSDETKYGDKVDEE